MICPADLRSLTGTHTAADDDVQRRLLGDARGSKTQPNLNDVHQDSAIGDPKDTSVHVSLEEIADPISWLPTVPPSQMLVNPMDMLSRPATRNSHANGSPASALLPPSTHVQTSNAGTVRSPPATLPLPSILPRNKSISAVQQRFQGKAAERRNSNSLQRPAQSSIQPVQLRRSAESEEDSDDEDSEDDIPSSSVQLTGIGTGHRASLAYLK